MAARISSRVSRGTRYWPSLMASGRPRNWAQSPRKSERIVNTTWIGSSVCAAASSSNWTKAKASSAVAVTAAVAAVLAALSAAVLAALSALLRKRNSSSNWSTTTSNWVPAGSRACATMSTRPRLPRRSVSATSSAVGRPLRAIVAIAAASYSTPGAASACASLPSGSFSGRNCAMRQAAPALAMWPRCSAGRRPQLTSDDLPLPDVPTTARKRCTASLSIIRSTWCSRPKNRCSSSVRNGRKPG